MKIIQMAGPCSISTATRVLLIQYFEKVLDIKINKELKSKGWFAEVDKTFKRKLTHLDNLKQVLYEINNTNEKFFIKTNIAQLGDNKDMKSTIQYLHAAGCYFIHSFRTNHLDTVLCKLRDFSEEARLMRRTALNRMSSDDNGGNFPRGQFKNWRESDERKEYIFKNSIEEILKNITTERKFVEHTKDVFDSLDVNIIELKSDVFTAIQHDDSVHIFDYFAQKLLEISDKGGVKSSLDDILAFSHSVYGRRPALYSHSSLKFRDFDNVALKAALDSHGLGQYWRQ